MLKPNKYSNADTFKINSVLLSNDLHTVFSRDGYWCLVILFYMDLLNSLSWYSGDVETSEEY